jgi:sulfur carrier protein
MANTVLVAQASITVNGMPRNLARDHNTIADLVHDMQLEGKRIAVEHNGAIVPRTRYADTLLGNGDNIEIVGAVGGG